MNNKIHRLNRECGRINGQLAAASMSEIHWDEEFFNENHFVKPLKYHTFTDFTKEIEYDFSFGEEPDWFDED